MKLKSDRKNYVIIALCAILLVMSIGYAAFSSLLTINGTASLSDSFCVGFDNTKLNTYVPTAGISGGTLPTGSMSYSGTACSTKYQPNSSLTATFKQPGDKIEYTLTIKNAGSINAAIKSITVDGDSVTSNTTKTKGNVEYIVEMPETTTLASGAETTMKVTVSFQNKTDVSGRYTGETQSLPIMINAEEDDGSGGMVVTEPKFTGTIYRRNTVNSKIGDTIKPTYFLTADGIYGHGPADYYDTFESCEETRINSYSDTSYYCVQKDNIGDYTTDVSTLEYAYYLKHDVVDDVIVNSYACFVYNNAEHCLKGGDGGASFAANTQIIHDYQNFYNLGLYSNGFGCTFNSSSSSCKGGRFNIVSAGSDGSISINGCGSDNCFLVSDGNSYCRGTITCDLPGE